MTKNRKFVTYIYYSNNILYSKLIVDYRTMDWIYYPQVSKIYMALRVVVVTQDFNMFKVFILCIFIGKACVL